MALVLTIGVVDRTAVLVTGSLRVEHRAEGFISVCNLTLVDEDYDIAITEEDAITVVDGATTFFSGRVVSVVYGTFTTNSRLIYLTCQDKNAQLGEVVIDAEEVFSAEADADIIDSLFDDYLPAVDSETHVDTIQDPLTITVGPCTMRAALSQICTRTGGYFYVDFDNKLHYFTAEADRVAWHLSDVTGGPGQESYFDKPRKISKAITRLDGIFVMGDGVSGWRGTHGAGDRTAFVRDNRITTTTGRDERGDAILAKYGSAQVVYYVSTYKAGLKAGMDIRFVCALYEVDDTFTVRKMNVKWDAANVAYYELEIGDPINPSLIGERLWIDNIVENQGPVTAPRLPTSSKGWTHTLIFSATDHDTVAWAGGDINLADGVTYNIDAGNTGNIAATTFIYLDLDTSETVLQLTVDSSVAVGSKKILIAWAMNVVVGLDAVFMVFGGEGQGVLVDTENIVDAAVTAVKAGPELQNWSHNIVFSSVDHDTVAWAADQIELADGTTYNIVNGNTGNMNHVTYIFLDPDVSIVALQTTILPDDAVGENRILIAVAEDVAAGKAAVFQTFGGSGLGVMITADQIVANTITANEIFANTITANEIAANTITAAEIFANTITAAEIAAGTITANEIAANTIVAGNIAVGTITTNEIAANTILAGNIAAGAIETDELAALAVTAAKIAANTIIATKLDMGGFGDLLYNPTDGLILLGPHCAITPTTWTSLRGQAATLSGAFHQGQGRWLGTRGLVIEEAGLNYELAPRMIEAGATGLAAGWTYFDNFGSGGDATLDVITHPVQERGWLQRITYTAAAGDVADVVEVYDLTAAASFAATDDCTLSFDVRGSGSGATANLRIVPVNAALGALGLAQQAITLTSSLQRVELTYDNLPATTDRVYVALRVTGVDDGDEFDVYFGAVNVEKKAYATSFCCGALDWCAWSGDEDDSTSTRTVTEVNLDAHVGLVSENNTLSILMRARTPYDADATWPGVLNLISAMSKTDTTQRILIQYNSTDDTFEVVLDDGVDSVILESAARSFVAGDWIDILVTADFNASGAGDYNLYLNGLLSDNEVTANIAAPVIEEWNLGGYIDGGYQIGFVIAEYAVFDRVVTTDEAAMLYAMDRPLIDAGSSTTPGIYILDGKFKLSSSQTGNRIELTAEEIAGYNSGDTKQFYLQASDGAGYFGGGVARMNANGLAFVDGATSVSQILWKLTTLAGMNIGLVYADWAGGGGDDAVLWLSAMEPTGGADGRVTINASPTAGAAVRFNVKSTGVIDATACTSFSINDGAKNTIEISGGNVKFALGDAAGAKQLQVLDSGLATVASIDSDGDLIVNTIATAMGDVWDLGDYTAVVPTVTGRLDVTINGSGYRIAVQAI